MYDEVTLHRVTLHHCSRLFKNHWPNFLQSLVVVFCNNFEELQTVLFEVELIINNAPNIHLPKYYRNMFNTQ